MRTKRGKKKLGPKQGQIDIINTMTKFPINTQEETIKGHFKLARNTLKNRLKEGESGASVH